MVDKLDPACRSANMSRIRGKDTAPEVRVRRVAHRMGLRFRLHRKDLPGRPDLVLPKHRLAVFVHGCFWHRHPGCPRASTPSTRVDFWQAKFQTNVERDARQIAALEADGWNVLVLWECGLKDEAFIETALHEAVFAAGRASGSVPDKETTS